MVHIMGTVVLLINLMATVHLCLSQWLNIVIDHWNTGQCRLTIVGVPAKTKGSQFWATPSFNSSTYAGADCGLLWCG